MSIEINNWTGYAVCDPSGEMRGGSIAPTRPTSWGRAFRHVGELRAMIGADKQRRAYAAGWRCIKVTIVRAEK